MKILKFQEENIKGIKAVEIVPEGEIVTISGPNGAGKSSVLDTIEALLCGGELPLKNGADKGKAELDLGEYTVTRVITEKTDRLVVKNKDGAQYPSPREFLSKVVGSLTIDPLAFIRAGNKEQLGIIFRLIPWLEPKLKEFDDKIASLKEDRSFLLKTGQKLKIELEAMKYIQDMPTEPLNIEELHKALEEENTRKKLRQAADLEIKQAEQIRDKVFNEKISCEKYIVMLEGKLQEARATLESKTKELEEITGKVCEFQRKLSVIPTESKEGEILGKIAQMQTINGNIASNKVYKAKYDEKNKTAEEWSSLGEKIKAVELEKADILGRDIFLHGLSIINGEVVFNNVPIRNLSTSEKVRVGASIAVALQPKAKIILADDASLLDKDTLKILHETCAGFQVWQVVNDTSGDVGIYIEAGEVKNV